MNPRTKKIVVNIAKLGFAGGLIFWLISSGKLDFSQLSILIERPSVLLFGVANWFFAIVCLGGLRWQNLLAGIGIAVKYFRVLQLHLIGLFFNVAMPGAVGGDLVKAVYVVKENAGGKTPAMLTILLDRIIGLMGLFTLGAIAITFNLDRFLDSPNPALATIVTTIYALFAGTVVFFILVFLPDRPENDPIRRFVELPFIGFSILKKIYSALLIYKQRPMVLVLALVLSIAIQGAICVFFYYLTYLINGEWPAFSAIVAIMPIGTMISALPLAPAGLGVGHIAFSELFKAFGIANGANVFNVHILLMLCLNLCGVLPYLLFKKDAPGIAEAVQLEAGTE